jgi:hypothetical protein
MPDATVIQCPQCSKKFKLPAKPPAVFSCTACGTAMDLSSFRDAAAAAPAAAPSAAPEPSSKASKSARSSSRSASPRAGKPARLTARVHRGRAAAAEEGGDGEDGEHESFSGPPKKSNTGILIAVFGLVVVGGFVLLISRKKSHEGDKNSIVKPEAHESNAPPVVVPEAAMTEAAMTEPTKPEVKKGTFHPVGHHPDATPEEQAKIDALIKTAIFENSGSDSRVAGDELVKMGIKAAPRIIDVFNTVKSGEGYDDRMGRLKAQVADALLRRIDGYQERVKKSMPIRNTSNMNFAEGVAKSWISWWDNEYWKKNPLKPWDPRVDGAEDGSGGGSAMDTPPPAMDGAAMDAPPMDGDGK